MKEGEEKSQRSYMPKPWTETTMCEGQREGRTVWVEGGKVRKMGTSVIKCQQ